MGDIARMHQAERFQNEFEKDYLATMPFKPGDTLTVVRTFMGQDDSDTSRLMIGAVLQDAQGEEYELEFAQVLDCEYDSTKDIEERVINALQLDEETARERVKKAGL